MKVSGRHPVCKEICDALGLKNVVSLHLHFAVDRFTTVTAKYFPEEDGVKKFPAILKRFELVEKE